MKDKKFVISGMVDNVEIPDTDDRDEGGEAGNGPFRMNISKKDLPDFLRNMKKGTGKNHVSPEEMRRIAKETGMDEGKISETINQINEMFKSAIDDNFIQKMEKLVNEMGDNLSQKDIDKEFDKVFSKIKDSKAGEDEELEDVEVESIVDERLSGKNFEVLLDPPTLGVVKHQRASKIMDLFKASFGDGPAYDVGVFSPNIKISNPIKGIASVSRIEYIEHDDSRVVFRALPADDKKHEPFIVAIIINDNSFEMVVPEYGNTYDVETGLPYDREKDAALYVETSKGMVLMSPVDMEKIRAGLELALFEDKRPTLPPGDFGRVIQSKHKATDSGRWIKVGKIQSNESLSAKIFKKDFDIDDEKTMFDFMVRLPEEHSYKVLDALSDYIATVDLNENGRIQSSELKANGTGELYVDLDLGRLPGNIAKWKDE